MKSPFATMLFAAGCAVSLVPPQASAAEADLHCKLHYQLTGWSVLYKHASGNGTISCDNGLSMRVHITAKAVGLTAGKWKIDDGHGDFTHIFRLTDVLGRYAQAGANAGLVKSAEAQVVTKGDVSLALAGNGRGVNLGVDVGAFEITR